MVSLKPISNNLPIDTFTYIRNIQLLYKKHDLEPIYTWVRNLVNNLCILSSFCASCSILWTWGLEDSEVRKSAETVAHIDCEPNTSASSEDNVESNEEQHSLSEGARDDWTRSKLVGLVSMVDFRGENISSKPSLPTCFYFTLDPDSVRKK